MTDSDLNVDLMERLKHLYVNLEQYSCDEIRSIHLEAISDLRDAEHMAMKKQLEQMVTSTPIGI